MRLHGFCVSRGAGRVTNVCLVQEPDGEWREDVLAALDFVVEAARAHGIRVMLSFADNWKYIGEALVTFLLLVDCLLAWPFLFGHLSLPA